MAFLELKNIHKSYFLGKEEFPVLKGIDLGFDKGEFVSILGESGGGKSTLMNIIGGLDRNFEGSVSINGEVLDHKQEKRLDLYRRKTIGYIFQSFNLINYQTNLENVMTSLNMTALSGVERKKRAIELLDQVGLKEHIHKYPNQLSGGQKQRVAIARALASSPDIIIADEPTGALDAVNTKDVLDILESIAKDGKLVIVVTHSQEVADYGTRILHMADGKIDEEKTLKDKFLNKETAEEVTSKPLAAQTIWNMAFDHIRFNKLRNFLITLGSAIGIFSVILFLGLGNGIKGYINDQVNQLANPKYPTVMKNVTTDKKASNNERMQETAQKMTTDYKSTTLSDQALKKITELDHVNRVIKGYQFNNASFTHGKTTIRGSQFQTWTPAFSEKVIKAGKAPGKDEILIDKAFAKKINSNWKSVIGEKVSVKFMAFNKDNTPVQVTDSFKVSGITDGGQAGPVFGTNYQTAKASLERAGALSEANAASVAVDKTENVKAVVKKVNTIKIDGKRAFVGISIGDILDTINTITSLASYVLAAIAGISLIVSAIMIIVTTYMSVTERTKEIGVLRALGARSKDIRNLFTSESLMIGMISAVVGLVAAYAGQFLMNMALHGMIKYDIVQISLGNVLFAIIISLVIALIASFVPSRKAAKLNTIDALAAD
ncbi:ABC transporter ATP-binding protein/permease [Liquorilactobacillus capillatus]|uniref:Peptide ABC transporter ATPase n=1 Tax=Liquorilactobacillus capillatus DSM 19910 TaxID=1423731 RepID=A0A0R1M315_9LACO|nr:ABC transporter ATP-binding protein/permease [Liquorilactobacillus capillatus]KRL02431.1 peptide ABC transporter ATPase [Liquorilactobacillus capillatus DSM 19910]